MRQIVYLTFNDLPGGIFTSQVIEVCNLIRKEPDVRVQLVCMISRRGFAENKAKILSLDSDAIVLPMFPGIGNWKLNRFALRRKFKTVKPDVIIARGPFATLLGRLASDARLCFDARGAYKAEFTEYDVSSGKISAQQIHSIEKEALESADFRIAVSRELVNYWVKEYHYHSDLHVVIPCTLSAKHLLPVENDVEHKKVRIVFSGGNGKWQSLDRVSELLIPYFKLHGNAEMIFLTNSLPESFELRSMFPDRVSAMWLREEEVHGFLATCDYGWLYREKSMTNKVASPVKFAEYLAAGLSVLISPDLGDFSAFVQDHQCGQVISGTAINTLPALTTAQKIRNRNLAKEYFTKEHFIAEYRRVIACG